MIKQTKNASMKAIMLTILNSVDIFARTYRLNGVIKTRVDGYL